MPPKPRATKTAAKRPARKTASTSTPRKAAAAKAPAKKRAPGRPRKLEIEPDLLESIAAKVRKGAHPERAAVAAGISERTHYLWQAKGLQEREHIEAGGKPRATFAVFLDYVDHLERAGAEAEIAFLEQAAKGGAAGSAALELLARRFRDRWGPKAVAAPGPPKTSTPAATTPLGKLEERRLARQQAAAQ
jgi:hypothetical protein